MPADLDWAAVARAIHVVAVVHWIGGVWFVTFVVLPAVARFAEPRHAVVLFEEIERGFAAQARVSTLAAGATGLWMTGIWEVWDRFLDPRFFWMHMMVALWAIFTIVLFVAEPLVLHAWFEARARVAPEATMRLVRRLHRVLSALAAATVAAAVLGAHGGV